MYVVVKLRCVAGCAAVAADFHVRAVPRLIPALTNKRGRFTNETKVTIVETANAHGLAEALRRLHNMGGYDTVTRQTIRRWKRALRQGQKKRGRHGTDDTFNRAVLDQLIFTVLENVADAPTLSVEANVCHSYDVIRCAAVKAQAYAEFEGNAHIQSLKFSPRWITTWIRNCTLVRRRVTTADKTLPSPEQVQAHMHGVVLILREVLKNRDVWCEV